MPLLTDAAFLLGNRWHPISYAATATDIAFPQSYTQSSNGTAWSGGTSASSNIGGSGGAGNIMQALQFTVPSSITVAGVAIQDHDGSHAGGDYQATIQTGVVVGGAANSGTVIASGQTHIADVGLSGGMVINIPFTSPVTLSSGTTYTVTFYLANQVQTFGDYIWMTDTRNPAGSTITVNTPRIYSNNGGVWTNNPDGFYTRFAFLTASAVDTASRTINLLRLTTDQIAPPRLITTFSDDFNRANGALTAPWTGSGAIASNKMQLTNSQFVYISSSGDRTVQATVQVTADPAGNGHAYISLGGNYAPSGEANGYSLVIAPNIGGGVYKVQRNSTTSWSTVVSGSTLDVVASPFGSHTLSLGMKDNGDGTYTVTAKIDGATVAVVIDGNPNSVPMGAFDGAGVNDAVGGSGGTTATFDDFSVSASGAPILDTAVYGRVYSKTATDSTPVSTQTPTWILTLNNTDNVRTFADWPVQNPAKQITGTVRDSSGSAFLSGATIDLIRDLDGFQCATTTSSLTDGTYTFLRDQSDPYTYTVRAYWNGAGGPIEDVTITGLTPTAIPHNPASQVQATSLVTNSPSFGVATTASNTVALVLATNNNAAQPAPSGFTQVYDSGLDPAHNTYTRVVVFIRQNAPSLTSITTNFSWNTNINPCKVFALELTGQCSLAFGQMIGIDTTGPVTNSISNPGASTGALCYGFTGQGNSGTYTIAGGPSTWNLFANLNLVEPDQWYTATQTSYPITFTVSCTTTYINTILIGFQH